MTRAVNEGKVKPLEGRKPENTTLTRFEDFAGEVARLEDRDGNPISSCSNLPRSRTSDTRLKRFGLAPELAV
jgi:hypothetical protein